jgi:hypothetical protein
LSKLPFAPKLRRFGLVQTTLFCPKRRRFEHFRIFFFFRGLEIKNFFKKKKRKKGEEIGVAGATPCPKNGGTSEVSPIIIQMENSLYLPEVSEVFQF